VCTVSSLPHSAHACPCIISTTASPLVTSSSAARSGRPKQLLLPCPTCEYSYNNNSRRNPRNAATRPRRKPLQAQTIILRSNTSYLPTLSQAYGKIRRGVALCAEQKKSSCSSRAPHSFTHWHRSDSSVQAQDENTNSSTTTSETNAWAIFDQTQLPDTSIASPSIGPIVIF
jgi:hypothetical protein